MHPENSIPLLVDENEYEELSGTPSQYDYWIFQRIAQTIPQMTCEEQPEMFWKPILDLGPVAHYWVENFLSAWILYGLRNAIVNYSSYDWRGIGTGELESLIVVVLWTCWVQHRVVLNTDQQLRQAFFDILTILTNRQSPSALQLRDEVLQSPNVLPD